MSVLPYNAKVEYIESTGTQYVDTEVIITPLIKVVITFQFTDQYTGICGFMNSNATQRFNIGVYQNKYHFGCGGANNWVNTIPVDKNIHTAELSGNGSVKIDGGNYSTNGSVGDYGNPTLYIFAVNRGTYVSDYSKGLRVYSCKIYNDDVLIRDYIPVRIGNTGVLYDNVTGCTSINTDFAFGRDIEEDRKLGSQGFVSLFRNSLLHTTSLNSIIPSGYTLCDYIDTATNFNNNRFANTGVIPNQDTQIVIDFRYFTGSLSQPADMALIAADKFGILDNRNGGIRGDYNREMTSFSNKMGNNVRYVAHLNKNNFYLDNVLLKTYTYGSFTSPYELCICGLAHYANVSPNIYIYKVEIYNDNTIIREYIPVKDANNNGYLFDTINKNILSFNKTGVIGGYDTN